MAEVRFLFITTNLEHLEILHHAKSFLEKEKTSIEIIVCYGLDEGIRHYQSTSHLHMVLFCYDPDVYPVIGFLPKLRHFNRTPVFVILTREIGTLDMVSLYQFGGEVCLQMQPSTEILIALCNAFLTRVYRYLLNYPPFSTWKKELETHSQERLIFNNHALILDKGKRKVVHKDKTINLPPKDFDLLFFMALNADHVLTHDQILERVWKQEHANLPAAICRLRKQIETPRSILVTVYGIGYLFCSR